MKTPLRPLRPLSPLVLVTLAVLVVLSLLTPPATASGPGIARPVAARVLGPGRATEPGFSGYVTAGGGALGVARLPDGRFGICLDTGGRAWPVRHGQDTYRRDPLVGYLTSRYLPIARRDAVTAAALWWAVGLDLHVNSAPARMRGHVATLRRESPAVYRRVARRHQQLLDDARRHATATGGYVVDRPVLGTHTVDHLGVHGASGRLVPGIQVSLRLRGGRFGSGRHSWTGLVPAAGAAGPRWRRTTAGPVRLTAQYAGIPASGYTMMLTGPSFQRVAVSAGTRTATRHAWLPALPRPALHTTVSSARALVGGTLVDAVRVTGAGTARLTGQWRLLGPVRPSASGCDGVDWTGAPRAASGTFTAAGDGVYSVGSTHLVAAGCYTYVERLSPSSRTRGTAWTPVGATSETSLVLARPTVRTVVSRQHATVGARLSDDVLVSGLPAGVAAKLHWRLLGPVAPRGDSCRGAVWDHAPVRSSGALVVRRNGHRTLGRTTVTRGGCYTYQERLEATALSAATGWTTAGLSSESSTVLPQAPQIPKHPVVDTGGSWSPAGRITPRGATASVSAPSVGLSSALLPVAFHGRTLTPPAPAVGGWWAGGARLDALVGTTVLAGHVSDDHDRKQPFSRLRRVAVGATITTRTAGGATTKWRVTRVSSYDRQNLPRSLFTQHLARTLVLITCTDKITYPNGAFHYRRNLVVTAVPEHR